MSNILPSIDEIDDQAMMQYLHHFLQIGEFKKIENGKQLLLMIKDNPEHLKVKSAVRKILGLFHTDSPGAKVCSLQFLKQAMETNCWSVIELVQRSLLPKVVQVTEYRPHIRSIQRGSSYFINNFDKNATDQQVSNLIKLSSTFFRMIHQCVYVWGALYFPGTSFDRMRIKLMKKFDFPKYPDQFKFFNEKKIENFKINCKDVIKKMKEYNDEVMSKSSVEKKRETSAKPSRVSVPLNNKNPRSQSTEQLGNIQNKKSTKQKQEEINSKKKISKQSQVKNEQVERKNEKSPRKQSESLSNSSLLRKKNSFTKTQVQENQSKNSPRKQQTNKHSAQPKISIDQNSSQKLRFKTISQQSDSEAGRYSVKESIQQTSQQFSEGDYLIENRTNQSPRSHIEMTKQNNNTKFPLKKYQSEQIMAEMPVKKIISLNEVKRDYKKQQQNNLKRQNARFTKVIQQPPAKYEKQKYKLVRQQIKVENQQQQTKNNDKTNKSNEKNEENKKPIKTVPKLPLSRQQKIQQEKRRKKDLSARKKFVSSEEQNSHKEIQNNKNETLNHQKVLDDIKVTTNNIRKNEKQQGSKERKFITNQVKQTNQQPQTNLPAKKNQDIVNPKPLRMAKPQKIKGTSSGKTVFQGKQYSIVQTINQAKPLPKQESKNSLGNVKPINIKQQLKQKPKTKIPLDKDIYKIVQDIEDTEIMTIQLKKVDPEIKVNKGHVVDSNKKLIQKQKVSRQNPLKQQYSLPRQQTKNKQQKIESDSAQRKQNRVIKIKQIQKISSHYQKQEEQVKIGKKISKPDPIRIYSPKRKDEKPQFESPLYSYRKQNQQNPADGRQNTAGSRLKKNHQVCMIIHPKDESLSEIQMKSRKQSIDEVKNLLKDQIAEQFAQLRNTLFSQQQQNIYQSVQSYTSKFKSQMNNKDKNKEKSAVDCGIQARIRQKHKKRVAGTRRYKMFDQTEEDKLKKNLNNTIVNTIQNNTLAVNRVFDSNKQANRDKSLKGNQTRTSSKNKVSLRPDEYEPNTLLYALYRKRSLINE